MTIVKGPDGRSADVDERNRLSTFSTSQSLSRDSNKEGCSFSIFFSVTPAGVNDLFFYLKNNGDLDVSLTSIRASSSVPTTLFYEHVSGSPSFVAEADAAVTSLNLGSALQLSVDAIFDSDITGLTTVGVMFFEECSIADTTFALKIPSNIIIQQGQAMAFRRESGSGTLTMSVSVMRADT